MTDQLPSVGASQGAPAHRNTGASEQGGDRAERWFSYLFVLPAVALVVVFRIVPLIWGFYLSLTNYNGISRADFVGLDNYAAIARDTGFQAAVVNTLILIATLPIWIVLPMILAILIYQGVPGGRLFRSVYFFPVVLSSVIIGTIFNVLLRFDGTLNALLKLVHIAPIDWLGGSSTALGSLIAVQLWATFGVNLLLFIAGLSTMSEEMLEAARLDGANLRQLWLYIVIPSLRPIIEFVTVVTTIGVLTSMFGIIYVLTAGGPGTATVLPEFLIWLEQGKMNQPGYAAAISIVLFVLMAGLAWLQIRIMTRNANI